MNCEPCRDQRHDACSHPKTCTCQHRKTYFNEANGTLVPLSEWGGALTDRDAFVRARDAL